MEAYFLDIPVGMFDTAGDDDAAAVE